MSALAALDPAPVAPLADRRLLSGPEPSAGAESLREHLARLGPRPTGGSWMVQELEASGLRGRGGAGFPAGRKWRSVADRTAGDACVVVNVAEGEPASAKDRTLAALRPHLVLDGAALAAESLRAGRTVIYIGRAHRSARRAVEAAIEERRRAGAADPAFEVVVAPDRYVSGESSAVVSRIDGGLAKPSMARAHRSGVGGAPTVIQNAETTAGAALIARFGAAWFRSIGTDRNPGTALLTVSGAVERTGVLEVEVGVSLGNVVAACGGLAAPATAVLVGGYFGEWLPLASVWDSPLGEGETASLGCGVMLFLPATSCGLAETARIVRYLAAESARQCGPCMYGLNSIAGGFERIARGRTDGHDATRLWRWMDQIRDRGACHHPDGASRLAASALDVFASDLRAHLAGDPCAGSHRPTILPSAPRARGWR